MPEYRAYITGADGHFAKVHAFSAADQGEAATVALSYVESFPVELWEGQRWIGTFNPSHRAVFASLSDLPGSEKSRDSSFESGASNHLLGLSICGTVARPAGQHWPYTPCYNRFATPG